MAKTYTFTKKDANRLRKVYRYIRKKPKFIFTCNDDFKLVVGDVTFTNTSGPVTFTYPSTVNYLNIPVVTAISHDSENNSQADVNIFITSITTTAVQFESSAPFTGKVHFHIYSQD
tara:strand:- start:1641 stop:1988 length:348 start_codon:yes stop_codon:yes gene_type:complete